jgi:hypothetical protein
MQVGRSGPVRPGHVTGDVEVARHHLAEGDGVNRGSPAIAPNRVLDGDALGGALGRFSTPADTRSVSTRVVVSRSGGPDRSTLRPRRASATGTAAARPATACSSGSSAGRRNELWRRSAT